MANGDPVKIGQTNTGTVDTILSSSSANAFRGTSTAASGIGVLGYAPAASGQTCGVQGISKSTMGMGVFGYATATSGLTYGVYGTSKSTKGRGVLGFATAASGRTSGVFGTSKSTSGTGVSGSASAKSGTTHGVYGTSWSTSGRGVSGIARAESGGTYGVYGQSVSTGGIGVYGEASAGSGTTYGVYGRSKSRGGAGVYAYNQYAAEGGQALKCHGDALPDADDTYNCGDQNKRWKLVRAHIVIQGDLVFENSFTVTEDENVGLAFKNDTGDKIAVLDRHGNFHIKGKFIEGLPS